MTDRLQELIDRQDITDLVHRLARAIDRCDTALMADCYHPDATDDHGMIKGSIGEFITAVVPVLHAMLHTQHNITNILVTHFGDEARGESYFIAQHSLADGNEMFAAGRYLDRFTRRYGVWKIAHRQAIYDWTMSVPSSGASDGDPMASLLRRGERGTGDPSYKHLAGE
jgi:ketosteroid isomerase-like protein